MADRVIFCMFDLPVPGRDQAAFKAFQDGAAYCQRKLEAGELEGHEQVLLDPNRSISGFMLLKGRGDQMARIAMDPEWQEICFRANASVQNFGIVGGTIGEGMMGMMAAFQGAVASFQA